MSAPSLSLDIALSLLFACTYFPEEAGTIAEYLLFYLEEKESLVNEALYKDLLGKPDVLPLSVFIAETSQQAGLQVDKELTGGIRHYCRKDLHPAYRQARFRQQ
ncbi:hypothetical protein [Chitinophaga japonensis]|uniref:hypothetical protein n=1 Tax=Chitinophaga japonensis TaxID=104662 RepID=UPI0013157DA0|nr:hypothetical protein [Chitinophaga japonensis]